jgi:uncharacterized Zn finger protein
MTARRSKIAVGARFDIAALRKLAGDKVFERGEDYRAEGQVELLSLESQRVVAQVAGSEDYRTILIGRGKKIGGECSCRAFTDWGFCKHMVATALAANDVGDDPAADCNGALARIRAHLKAKGVDHLVDMIVDLAEREPALFRKLDLAATAVKGDDKAVEARLRRAIDGATRTGTFVDYREAEDWADGVADALAPVAGLAEGDRADVAIRLAEHAIDRIEQAVESIDDSDGHCGALLEQARDTHLAACRAARPDPVMLAASLFEREMDDRNDAFYRAAAVYEDVLGDAGLAEYRRLAEEAWKGLPPRLKESHYSADHSRLEGILDFFAERSGNVDERIALRARDLSSPWHYLQLAEFCLQVGRKDEAQRRAEEGLWTFEDDEPHKGLTLFAADLLAKSGRKPDAEKHLWRAFDLLVRLLMREKMFDAAWSTLEKHGCTGKLQEDLADASRLSHPDKALAVYAKLVEEHAKFGRYEEAVRLIDRMGALREPAQQIAYLAGLKDRHRRKRNFMMLLA